MTDSILLLYRPKSDNALLGTGSWRSTLPIANVTDPRLSKVARSTDTQLSSTQFVVLLTQPATFKAIVLGPMNVTSGYQYRLRSFTSSAFSVLHSDSGWIKPFSGSSGDPLELEWEDPNFWLGILPFDDDERGVYLIHVFDTPVTAQYWGFELDDQFNPDGYIEIGRLFMPRTWAPSRNYAYSGNNLSFANNALSSQRLDGGEDFWRRVNQRVFRFSIDTVDEAEAFSEAYALMRVAGYDGEVFVIPEPSDPSSIQQRSFLGRITQMDGITQAMFQRGSVGFEIKEKL